jgi:hypothetical protein
LWKNVLENGHLEEEQAGRITKMYIRETGYEDGK